MPEFTVIRDDSVLEQSVFDVAPLTITRNPFGNFVVIKMDDRGGEKFDAFERGTRVDVSVDPDSQTLTIQSGDTVTTDSGTTDTYTTVLNAGTYENAGTVETTGGTRDLFTGYVVERRESEQEGADVLEVEAYSFDQFLRRNTVTNDQTGNTITEALADIIQTDTPVTYNAANVAVGDDQELTRGYQGENVETVLRDLSFKSNNEDFGVDDDLEFFFRPLEATHIDRGIDNTQWFRYDIPELGKEAINEVEVWFDGGEESVIVDDGTDKLDLQDSLDLPSPGTQRAELNRPLITDINDAEDIGRKYLSFKNATLSGTVTTYGLFDAEPGDTIDVTIDPRGIDEEFVIASTEYRWGVDETILTIVEKRGDVDDILAELNDSVQRQEMEGANRDAPKNRITTTNATGVVSPSVTVTVTNSDVLTVASGETLSVASGETLSSTTVENAGTLANAGTVETVDVNEMNADGVRFVNSGRNAVRDAWTGDSPPDITEVVVGSDGGGLSRSNTSLRSVTATASATEALPTATSVEYTATVNESGVEEVGLRAADGTLVARAVFDTAVDLAGDVVVTLDVSNDASVSRGVLTSTGQEAVRDVLADNTPAIPNQYAYGSSDTAVSEGDTALGNELVTRGFDEILLQRAETEAQWQNIVPSDLSDQPLEIDDNGVLSLQQSAVTREGENAEGNPPTFPLEDASDNITAKMEDSPASYTYPVSFDYDIAPENVGIAVRDALRNSNDSTDGIDWFFNGEQLDSVTGSQKDFSWSDFSDGGRYSSGFDGYTGETLRAGEKYELTIEVAADATNPLRYEVDVICVYDSRFSYNFDNTIPAGEEYLDGPETHPDSFVQALTTAETRRDVTEAAFDTSVSDTSNNWYVELSNDGQSFVRVNNSQSGSVTFSSPEAGVDTNISFSRYGSRTTATPQTGFLGQSTGFWELTANPQAVVSDGIGTTLSRGVIEPGVITGETVREAGLKSDGALLTRHLLADFEVLAGQRLSSSETTTFTGDN
jgi:hypothetical protein